MDDGSTAAARVRTGGCLCGAVRYEVTDPTESVSLCHCGQCRRQHGLGGAYARVRREALRLVKDEGLTWFRSSGKARRGFCRICGSALFWEDPDSPFIDPSAGSFDPPTGLRLERHIFVADKGDWYEIGEDGLPRRPG